MTPVLELDEIDFAYGGVQVLFSTTLDVRQGEVVALLGPNGAGKTTLLRVAAGLEHHRRGAVWVAGEDVSALVAEERVAKGIVSVFAGEAVFPDLTVDANLRVGGHLLDAGELRERTESVYELFPRLLERRSSLAVQLSGGEQQMLALGKAFLLRPKILCIDELSLGLAPALVNRLVDALGRFRELGVSILLVEQAAAVAARIADRAAFMERGEIRTVGPAAEILSADVLRELFLTGAPS